MAERLSLTRLPGLLAVNGYEAPSYWMCWTAAVRGAIPVKQGDNKRWTFHTDDLPQIADALGLSENLAA